MTTPGEHRPVKLLDRKSSSYSTLAPLATALELPFGDALTAALLFGRTPVTLSLEVDSGVVRGVTVLVHFEVLPGAPRRSTLTLRKETARDRSDKQDGVSVEVQLGAALFDRDVYIDSDATDAEVRRVLASETTRDHIVWLLDAVGTVQLAPRGITVTVPQQDDGWGAPRLLRTIDALLAVSRVGAPRGVSVPRAGAKLPGLVGTVAVASLAAFVGATVAWGAGFLFPVVGFVGLGLAAVVPMKAWATPRVAGDSGSGDRLRAVVLLTFFGGGGLGAGALLALNALTDPNAPVLTRGVVFRSNERDSEGERWKVRVRFDDGSTDEVWEEYQWPPGSRATRTTHPGRFVAWGEAIELSRP